MLDGLPASQFQLPSGPWSTVLEALCACFPGVDAATWQDRFARGRVLDAEGSALDASAPYRLGAEILYFREVVDERVIPFAEMVVHADAHLVVACKPHFLPVVPAGAYVQTLLTRLVRRFDNPRWCRCTASIATPPDWCCSLPTRPHAGSTRRCSASGVFASTIWQSHHRCRG